MQIQIGHLLSGCFFANHTRDFNVRIICICNKFSNNFHAVFFFKDFFVIIILFYVEIGIWHWIKDEFDFGFNLVRVFYFKLSEITTL